MARCREKNMTERVRVSKKGWHGGMKWFLKRQESIREITSVHGESSECMKCLLGQS